MTVPYDAYEEVKFYFECLNNEIFLELSKMS